jgi:hypothetical protein
MKGITPAIAIIVLIFIAVVLVGTGWMMMSGIFSAYTHHTITMPVGGYRCSGVSTAEVLVRHSGTEEMVLSEPPKDFNSLGNMVPNSGFEIVDETNRPLDWVHDPQEYTDVVLVTDLSNSMTNCMDSRELVKDQNTLLLLHFNESTAKDESGWGHQARLGDEEIGDNHEPLLVPDGKYAGAFSFDGDDYIDFGNILNPRERSWTICTWFNWDGTPYENIIFNKENLYELRVYNRYVYYAWQPDWNWRGYPYFKVEPDRWYHVCVVYDRTSNRMRLYKDGKLVFSRGVSGDMGANEEHLKIGARGKTGEYPKNFFNGVIDEFVVYDRVLTGNETRSLANRLNRTLCPADGPDHPSWCRFETSLCPTTRPDSEESYAPEGWDGGSESYEAPELQTISFEKNYCMQHHISIVK